MDKNLYLDAVTKAAERTRATLYLIVLTMLIVVAAYRNSDSPDWINARAQKLQTALNCWNAPHPDEPCMIAKDYARKYGFSLDGVDTSKEDDPRVKDYHEFLNEYRKRIAELR